PGSAVLFHALEGSFDVRVDDETHRVEAGELLRFDGDRTVEPTAREDGAALIVLTERSDS
ncbi:cupin, partial [Halorubrum sp. SD626R]